MVSAEVTREAGAGTGRLGELYLRHAPAARSLAYLLTGDRHLAEDLVQEAFVRLTGRFRHLRNPDAFGSYLRRTVVNLHTSHLRRRRLERAYLERRGREAAIEGAGGSLPDVAGRQDLWRALQTLPARQRAAVVLRYYEDLSESEAADALGCSLAAVKSLVARAMETLRTQVRSEDR
jgi:RNA polymerase sigma-70 factor (sigma-E family)